MRHLFKKKSTYYYAAAIAIFLLVDIAILSPQTLQNKKDATTSLNHNIARFTPAYSATTTRTLDFNIRTDYLFRLELENPKPLKPHPRSISKDKFLGYISSNTKLRILLEGIDPAYKKDKFQELYTTINLTPGKKVITRPGFGSLSGKQIQLTVDIQKKKMDIKLAHDGLLWNSYAPADVYYITMSSKKIVTVELTPQMLKDPKIIKKYGKRLKKSNNHSSRS